MPDHELKFPHCCHPSHSQCCPHLPYLLGKASQLPQICFKGLLGPLPYPTPQFLFPPVLVDHLNDHVILGTQ